MNGMRSTDDAPTFTAQTSEIYTGRRRLDAYAHNPAARAIRQRFYRNAESVARLGSLARAFVPPRFKRVFGTTGTPYLDSEPIFKTNPGIAKTLTPATRIDPEKYMVDAGWLLMACSGQIYGLNGQAILANGWHEKKVVTQHIMRIVPDTSMVRSGYLEVVLTHPTLGQPLVISRAHGTSVPELAPEDIEGLPIPRLAGHMEDEIADMAERANELRMQANEKKTVWSLVWKTHLRNTSRLARQSCGQTSLHRCVQIDARARTRLYEPVERLLNLAR